MRKVISILLMVTMVFVLFGCSQKSEPSSDSKSSINMQSSEDLNPDEENAIVDWPGKTIEIVVPSGAGGDTDFNARLLAQYLSKELDTNFVVSNVTGNGGVTGTRQVKDADNDGSVVLFHHSAFVCNQLSGASDYGFEAFEFADIAAMSPGNAITVRSDLGFKDLKDLIEYSQEHPGELTIAASTGATTHATALLLKSVGADLTIVDAGGAADRLAAILGGHVDVIINSYGSIKDYVEEGKLTPLALDGLTNLDEVGITSVVDQGYDIGFPFYYFFAFPKGTDQTIIEKMNAAVEDIVLNNSEYREKISSSYYQTPIFYGSEEGLALFEKVYDSLESLDFKG